MPDTRQLPDPDPAVDKRKRHNVPQTAAIPPHMHEPVHEITDINHTKLGVIFSKAIHAGLPLVREDKLADREHQRPNCR